jgi:hypothetical protein
MARIPQVGGVTGAALISGLVVLVAGCAGGHKRASACTYRTIDYPRPSGARFWPLAAHGAARAYVERIPLGDGRWLCTVPGPRRWLSTTRVDVAFLPR